MDSETSKTLSGTSHDNVIVATLRDEGPYILEWLAYHHLIGFDHFFLFSNDCSDHSDALLEAAQALGIVSYFDNTKVLNEHGRRHTDPQRRAYRWASTMFPVRKANRILVIDADEFFRIKVGDGHLRDLYAVTGPFDALSATWRFFGTNDISRFTDDLVISQFTKARPEERPKHVRKWGVKTLSSFKNVKHFGVHRPIYKDEVKQGNASYSWINGSAEDVGGNFRAGTWRVNRGTHGSELAEINHYAVRSAESFLMKRRRGSANSSDAARLDQEYFALYNHNDVTEDGMRKWVGLVRDLVAEWCQNHPDIAQLHAKTVAYHQDTIDQLKRDLSRDDPTILTALGIPSGDTNEN